MSGDCSSGSSPYYTEWNQTNTRLTVTGNVVQSPSSILICGDTTLDMNTANNFHITLNGNINLINPILITNYLLPRLSDNSFISVLTSTAGTCERAIKVYLLAELR